MPVRRSCPPGCTHQVACRKEQRSQLASYAEEIDGLNPVQFGIRSSLCSPPVRSVAAGASPAPCLSWQCLRQLPRNVTPPAICPHQPCLFGEPRGLKTPRASLVVVMSFKPAPMLPTCCPSSLLERLALPLGSSLGDHSGSHLPRYLSCYRSCSRSPPRPRVLLLLQGNGGLAPMSYGHLSDLPPLPRHLRQAAASQDRHCLVRQ